MLKIQRNQRQKKPAIPMIQKNVLGVSVIVPLISTMPGDGCVSATSAVTSATNEKLTLFVPLKMRKVFASRLIEPPTVTRSACSTASNTTFGGSVVASRL